MRGIAIAAAAVALAALPAGAPGRSQPPQREAADLASGYARPWPTVQDREGRFHDYLSQPAGRYDEAMLGLGLLQEGVRADDPRLVHAGLRGIGYAAARPELRALHTSVFEDLAMATAYNLAVRRLRGLPAFERLRPSWERWLRKVRPVGLDEAPSHHNHRIVEALSWLELARTGLESQLPGAVLEHPRSSRRRAARFLDTVVPRLTRPRRRRLLGRAARMVSDKPAHPLAYHALNLGMLARAGRLLGGDARPAARALLREIAHASWILTAPDGDLAYTGRSQEQAWALSFAAYGAEEAARLVDRTEARRLRALSLRALRRLRSRHGMPAGWAAITPAVALDVTAGARGVDFYADSAAFNGLVLAALGWLAELPPARGGASKLAADRRLAAGLEAGSGDFAVVRRRRVWMAVRRARDPRGDLRSDFGLVVLKRRTRHGWRDVLPLRPTAGPRDSAGPVLLRGRRRALPTGGRLRARTGRAGFAVRFGARRRTRFSVRALRCGARIAWGGRRGDLFEYSGFFRGGRPRVGRRSVRGGGQRLRFGVPISVRLRAGYASGTEPWLVRARARFRLRRSGTAAITITDTAC